MRAADWLRNGVLACGSVLLGFALIEFLARLATSPPRYHELNHLEFHPELGLRQVPGLEIDFADAEGPFRTRLSSEGFRGREIPPVGADPAPAGVTRIAFVGDSFLVGLALREENLVTARTEHALAERGRPAEVYNLSSTDYGTGQELLLLRRFAPRIQPDVVVLSLYPSNDFANNTIALAGRTTGSPGDYIRPYVSVRDDRSLAVTWVHPWRAWLRRHSRVFSILERGALGLGREYDLAWLEPWPPRPDLQQRLRSGLAPTEELEIHRRQAASPAWRAASQTTFELLRAVRDECAEIGARLLVFVIPRFVQVHADATSLHSDLLVRQSGARPLDQQLDWNEPEATLARFFGEEGIDARIGLDPFRATTAQDGASIYLRDGHLDSRGHEVAAREIVDWFFVGGSSGPPQSTGPVPLLPPAQAAPSLLDFARDRYDAHLVLGGWLEYRRISADAAGWLIGANSQLALPARKADLVVRGRLASVPRLPVQLRVALLGGDAHVASLEREGPFEIRLRRPVGLALHGYVVVELSASPVSAKLHGLSGLMIEQIGFDERSSPDG